LLGDIGSPFPLVPASDEEHEERDYDHDDSQSFYDAEMNGVSDAEMDSFDGEIYEDDEVGEGGEEYEEGEYSCSADYSRASRRRSSGWDEGKLIGDSVGEEEDYCSEQKEEEEEREKVKLSAKTLKQDVKGMFSFLALYTCLFVFSLTVVIVTSSYRERS
jgi:hypothetical protein